MVVFQDADADAFERGQLAEFRQVRVVEILHAHRTLVGAVGAFVAYFDADAGLLQFGDGFLGETSALFAPEADAYG